MGKLIIFPWFIDMENGKKDWLFSLLFLKGNGGNLIRIDRTFNLSTAMDCITPAS